MVAGRVQDTAGKWDAEVDGGSWDTSETRDTGRVSEDSSVARNAGVERKLGDTSIR